MDHSATTPVDPLVVDAMLPFFTETFGNASSLHSFGTEAAEALSKARKQIAYAIGALPEEIIFTSGGTESDNLAIRGVVPFNARKKHIITSVVEHPAVLNTCASLESLGHEVTYLPVDADGVVDAGKLEASIKENTVLISIMHANNEVGTIQPIEKLSWIAKEHDLYFHTDAVQSVGKIPVNVDDLGVDMLSISSHKIHGPKGVGALYIRKGTNISPIVFGGNHEKGMRSGTENVSGIVGFARAMEIAIERLETDSGHMNKMRDSLISRVFDTIPDVRLNGHPSARLPNNVNVSFKYVEGESMLMMLDMQGVAVSTGSACSSKSLKASHVLSSLKIEDDFIHGSLRISLGRENTMEDIDYVVNALQETIAKLRAMSPLAGK
ncbi:cysteine desulfurase NifS [uncultured Methanolobus sp.]|uniref:cysteine desulfurase NifS n=1 Tax=uncultured Methanolobus sp. TaxID=218300 RepID=UPI0037492667